MISNLGILYQKERYRSEDLIGVNIYNRLVETDNNALRLNTFMRTARHYAAGFFTQGCFCVLRKRETIQAFQLILFLLIEYHMKCKIERSL